ncbi:MAG: DNA polymerase III subunit gamma/tau [Patescibacteria group bacterium]|nr:DNA polymerase III subunit gamma/tau [Patescibacteria group bacterium]
MAVLYRKYRPQTFAEVVGQEHVVRTLKNQLAAGQVAHAYLFTGSRGVGKTTLARILAKAVNCKNRGRGPAKDEAEPCGECDNCRAIAAGNFLDLIEVDAASNTSVENVRELIEHIKFSPSQGKYKVFIIDEVHMLSKSAFNALLKTLEEPPQHAIFVLATTEVNKVLPTIISRTQRFDFRGLSVGQLENYLRKILTAENVKLPLEVVRLVAENAGGGARDALSLLDKIITLGEGLDLEVYERLLGITDIRSSAKLLELILGGGLGDIPLFFDELGAKGLDLSAFNRDFLEYLRKVLVFLATGGQLAETDKEHQDLIAGQAQQTTLPEMIYVTRLFLKSLKDLYGSPRPEIPLLVAALEAASKRTGKQPLGQPAANKQPIKQPILPVSDQAGKQDEPAESLTAAEGPADEVSLAETQEWWPKFLDAVKKRNSPLANLLKGAELQAVQGEVITLGVKFSFHRQNLENQKNQSLIRECLKQVSGKQLAIRARVVAEERQTPKVGSSLTDALQVFGGELVE